MIRAERRPTLCDVDNDGSRWIVNVSIESNAVRRWITNDRIDEKHRNDENKFQHFIVREKFFILKFLIVDNKQSRCVYQMGDYRQLRLCFERFLRHLGRLVRFDWRNLSDRWKLFEDRSPEFRSEKENLSSISSVFDREKFKSILHFRWKIEFNFTSILFVVTERKTFFARLLIEKKTLRHLDYLIALSKLSILFTTRNLWKR